MSHPSILVWGAGAIGGTLGAYWSRAGLPVTMVDLDQAHADACATTGLKITGPVEQFCQVIPTFTPQTIKGQFDIIVLAVKAQATEAALGHLVPHLAPDGYVLSAQNGLNEILIDRVLGAGRTMGCFVNFGADWHGPGEILFGNRSALVIGEIDGSIQPRTREMFELAQIFEPDAVLTTDIWSYLWGKLGYGAMLFASALNHDSMTENFADPARLPVWLALGREVAATALARGVTPRGFGGFDPMAFAPGRPDGDGEAIIHWLRDYTAVGAKTHSGVWRDLAVRKRQTEAEAQIAIIAPLAAEHGIATPAIHAMCRLIGEIEAGQRGQSPESFAALMAAL
jgi:2-dehydropantoate 2-reductase